MTRKLIHCPKCGKGSFINLNDKEEEKINKKEFDKILRAVASVPPPKN